jgi:hypothetical protein
MTLVILMGNLNLLHPVVQFKILCGIFFQLQVASSFLLYLLFLRNDKWMLLDRIPSREHYATSSPHCGTIKLHYVYALYLID